MSYLVLARKWRPQTFSDVVGQTAIVRTLRNALKHRRVAHAMIFSGVRGVGKTTLARIMAKALNCHAQDKAPCGACPSCDDIKNGTAIDLHEIDGASNRGIQEIRDLKENIRFRPTQERYKIIIIDEVHMLTTEAFNALLKTLEEPPEHVYFMFATTEPHKVPVTILSRCQRYELQRVRAKDLADFFARIAREEGVSISPAALATIAREADGSVRDGLSLLDQVFSFGGDEVTDEDLVQVLGLVDGRIFAAITARLLDGDLAGAVERLHAAYTKGMDLKRFAHGLLDYARVLLLCKTCRNPADILDMAADDLTAAREQAAGHSEETLSALFHLLLTTAEAMQRAVHPRMTIEMGFIKAVQLGQVLPVTQLIERLDACLRDAPAGAVATAPAARAPPSSSMPSCAHQARAPWIRHTSATYRHTRVPCRKTIHSMSHPTAGPDMPG